MDTQHWAPVQRWINDISLGSYDDVAAQIHEYLTTEWEFEDLEVLDWTEPEFTGEGYIVRDVEIRYTWGYTDDFRAKHGVAI